MFREINSKKFGIWFFNGCVYCRYQHDTDKILTQLRFVDTNGNVIGAINWFAVHPTSMNNTNKLVTTDNVGYASILLEGAMEPQSLPGKVIPNTIHIFSFV